MKLAFSTNAYKQQTLEQAVASIASIGYAGLEIMADRPHAYPPDMPAERVQAVRAQMDRLGLTVSNINAFTLFAIGDTYHPSWIEDDEQLRRQRIAHTRACIAMAPGLGARTISLEPGGPLEGVERAAAPVRYREGLEELLGEATAAGVVLCVEPEPGLFIETSQEYLEFIQDFASPNVRMNLDLGHLFCVGEDPAEAVKRLAGEYAHVHIEDIAANRVHQHLVPGTGAMDFDAIRRALERVGYDGWVTVELYPFESTAEAVARQAFEFLRRHGF